MFPTLAAVLVVAGCGGSSEEGAAPGAGAAPTEAFVPGQVWHYRTREGEEGSLVHVGMVDELPEVGTVVHVLVSDVRIPRAGSPDPEPENLGHLALTDAALRASVVARADVPPELDGFVVGYESWKREVAAGGGGVLEMTVAEVLDLIEARMNPDDAGG